MSRLLQDPWFVATIERAIAKQGRGFTRRELRVFRKQMARTFETHPVAIAILAGARPDLAPKRAIYKAH